MAQSGLFRVFETVLPLLVMLGLGMLCRRKSLLTRDGVGALKSLVVNITLPAVLFAAFATAEYSAESVIAPAVIFGCCLLALWLGFALCKALRVPGRLSPYLATGFEAGMLGYALFTLLFPEQSASRFAMVDLGQVLFVFTVYKAMLSGKGAPNDDGLRDAAPTGGHKIRPCITDGLRNALRDAVRSPVIWAIIAGLVTGASGLYRLLASAGLDGVFSAVTGFVAAPTSAVILLTIGYDLAPREIDWQSTTKLALMRLLVMGALFGAVYALNRFALGGIIHTGALALLFILPPPYVLPVFARVDTERATIASALSVLTIATLLLFAALTVVFA